MRKVKSKKLTHEEAVELTGNTHMAYYTTAAQQLGIEFEVLIRGLFVEFRKGNKKWRIHKALTPINDSVAMSLVTYKNICHEFLLSKGFPVPKQRFVADAEEIIRFQAAESIESIVVKPTRGFGGMGVSIQPKTEEEIRHAYNFAEEKSLSKNRKKVLVEEFLEGKHYRLLVLENELIAASERTPPTVIGDGKSTIKKLIARKNKDISSEGRSKIRLDDESEKALESQKLTLDTVPQKGQTVTVRFNANMTSGGSTRECLAEVHEEYKKLAVSITTETGLKLAGIDLITPDISNPKVKHGINEVNHNPGLRIHYLPDKGDPVDVAVPIQQYILDNI